MFSDARFNRERCLRSSISPGIPLTIFTLGQPGTTVRVNSQPDLAATGSGSGSTTPEQFYAYNPASITDTTPIKGGQTTILRSKQTGLYCRLATVPGSSQKGMMCDASTPASATVLTFTGSGLAYNGVPLAPTGPNQTLVLDASASAATSALSITPAPGAGVWRGQACSAGHHHLGCELLLAAVADD